MLVEKVNRNICTLFFLFWIVTGCFFFASPAGAAVTQVIKWDDDLNGAPLVPGDLVDWTIEIYSTTTENNVIMEDDVPPWCINVQVRQIPAGAVDLSEPPPAGIWGTGLIRIQSITVPANSHVTIQFRTTIDPGAPDQELICNRAKVWWDQILRPIQSADRDEGGPTCNTIYDLPPNSPFLSATKRFSDVNGGSLEPGDTIQYTVQISNTGTGDSTGTRLLDDVPSYVTSFSVDSVPAGAVNNSLAAPSGANGTGLVDISGFTIPIGGTATIVFSCVLGTSVPNNTNICNQGSVTSTEITNPVLTEDPDLGFPKTCRRVVATPNIKTSTKTVQDLNGGNVELGDTLRYTVTVINTGSADALGVRVIDDIPPNLTSFQVTSIPAGATDSSSAAPAGANGTGYLNVININVPAHGQAVVEFTVAVAPATPNGTQICNQASVYSATIPVEPTDDPSTPGTDNDATCVTVLFMPIPDFNGSTKTQSGGTGGEIAQGAAITYTITVDNAAGAGNATNVQVTDDIPANLQNFQVISIPPGAVDFSLAAPAGANGTGLLDVRNFNVAAGGSAVIRFSVTVSPSAPEGTQICNQAGIASAEIAAPVLTDDPDTAGIDDPVCLSVVSGGCQVVPSVIQRLQSAKNGDAIEQSWLPEANSGSYRVYSVLDPLQIDSARAGNPLASLRCDVSTPNCSVSGAVSDPDPLVFYQVVGACSGDPSVEGPN
jgi:uncharacterized repeat protein (TIGR01451 family)